MAPGVILTFIVCVPLILLLYKKALIGPIPDYPKVLAAAQEYRITNWSLFWKCAFVLAVVVIGFLLHPIHHLELSLLRLSLFCFVFFFLLLCVGAGCSVRPTSARAALPLSLSLPLPSPSPSF
jgi:Na+/H+ antiporter NhaD/arsenite permease-like protein